MGGVEVANGSTLSTTGEMQVSCNVPYVLSVDGVEWVPIASAGGVDTYLLSTSGVVRIFINGTRYFLFTNTIVSDFDLTSTGVLQNGVRLQRTEGSYCQLPFTASDVEYYIYFGPIGDIESLNVTSNQGSVALHRDSAGGYYVTLASFDKTSYCAVFVGNVLIAFFEPRS